MNFAWVFIGGGLGSILRYAIGLLFSRTSLQLPVATLIANVTACLVFAACLLYIESRALPSSTLKVLVLTGFCGGLSTFSTFGYETWLLLKQSSYSWALMNIVISLALCTGCFMLIKK